MRYTEFFLPTLRQVPAEAEVISHQMMFRAAMIRKVAAGIYNWLPLGLRSLRKVQDIVRDEMNRAGAQEVLMPAVQPGELWQESGRWEDYGRELLRFSDRHDRDFCLGPTHEEVITALVRADVRSYRELPLNLYQIQTKFRDEIRPRFGVMRAREFEMKDAYSFDADEKGLDESYRKMFDAYTAIFKRCGLKFQAVEALTGPIGGSYSHEFMVLADTGEDLIATCKKCGYAANMEKAEVGKISKAASKEKEKQLKKVHTPDKRTVEDVCEFLKVKPEKLVKTLIYESEKGPVAALVRGDRELNEFKLMSAVGAETLEMATAEKIKELTGGPLGFSGPVGLDMKIICDREVELMKNFVIGANELDYHYMNANITSDFKVDMFLDLRVAVEGDPCPRCDKKLKTTRGIEVGHVFKLGTKYSEAMGAKFLDSEGSEKPLIMGCYGLGTGRTVAAAIEQNHDSNGIIWPAAIAPFHVYLMPININDEKIKAEAEKFHAELDKAGIEVLYDERDERPGVKFKDADLLGIPLRVVIGDKTLAEDSYEFKLRREEDKRLVPKDEALRQAKKIIGRELKRVAR